MLSHEPETEMPSSEKPGPLPLIIHLLTLSLAWTLPLKLKIQSNQHTYIYTYIYVIMINPDPKIYLILLNTPLIGALNPKGLKTLSPKALDLNQKLRNYTYAQLQFLSRSLQAVDIRLRPNGLF